MIVEPETFRRHIQQVKKYFTIIPLSEWIDKWTSGQPLPPKACCITFDDGWLDNYEYAFPILQQEQVPATLFAVSHMIGTTRQFWPNRINALLQLPACDWQSIPWLKSRLENHDRTPDKESIAAVISRLKHYPDNLLHQWLDQTEHLLKKVPPALMNWEQLRDMASSGLVEVGSHTCHHYRLRTDLEQDIVIKELQDSKERLTSELDQPVELFCYPNGDVCEFALKQVPSLYKAAVTTAGGINSAKRLNPYQLMRIGLHEDRSNTSNKFGGRLSGWL